MSAGHGSSWRFIGRLLAWFLLLCLVSQVGLATYVSCIAGVAKAVLDQTASARGAVGFQQMAPRISWAARTSAGTLEGSLSAHLLTYNGLLYLALVLAFPGWSLAARGRVVATGIPVVFLFHVADLLLAVESQLLTSTQPQSYTFWREFSLWFVLVKFSHSFSVLALKQVLPALLFYFQCRVLARWFSEYRNPMPWSRGPS